MRVIVEACKQVGTEACARDRLKSLVRILASWSAHALTTASSMLSGPAVFVGFTALRCFFTSCSQRERGGVLEFWRAGGSRCMVVGLLCQHGCGALASAD